MLYPSLSTAQQAQAETLFFDSVFGTDPAAFDYEIEAGQVIGRLPLVLESGRKFNPARGAAVTLTAIRGQATPEQIERAERAFNDLTRAAALSLSTRIGVSTCKTFS